MSKKLVIGTEEFEFPIQGSNPDYAEEVSDWAQAVTDALSTVQQPNDVTRTQATILNNITTPATINGFQFDVTEVRSINSEYLITRTTDVPAVNLVESGFIEGNFDGSTWSIAIRSLSNAGVNFDITNSGQITYTSSNLTGTNYKGTILFRAKVFNE